MGFKRNSVIALYFAGRSLPAIDRELEHFKVNKVFVHRTITRYNRTGNIAKRHEGGHQKTGTSGGMVQNPRRSANQVAKELKISDRSVRRTLKNNLKVKHYKTQKALDLTPKQQKVRLERAKELLRLVESGQFPNFVFSDEKIFQIEQFVNSQNDRVYLTDRSYKSLSHRLPTRRQHPPQVMVWTIVTADKRSSIVLIEPGGKVNAKYY